MNATTSGVETPLAVAARLAAAVGIPKELLDELHRLHSRQWRLEDETRVPGTPPEVIASAKAEIDRSNARRHHLIDLIDAAGAQPAVVGPCRYYSETVGELCDRLLILHLKQRALSNIDTVSGVLPIPGLERTCRHLATVATQLIDDLAGGRAALPPRVGVKIYNSSTGSGAELGAGLSEPDRSTSAVGR